MVGDRVLVATEEGEERTKVGLYLPPTAVDTQAVQGGRIVATCPGLPLPDLTARAAQLYLSYLGYRPGAVDGIAGRMTLSALRQFESDQGLPDSDKLDEDTVERLREALDTPAALVA